MAHDHATHGVSPHADRRFLRWALGLLALFLAVEVVVAIVSGSLALLSDAGHMLSDLAVSTFCAFCANAQAKRVRA